MKFNKICVLGLGYIGLPTASTFATHGVNVVGVDVSDHVISTLRNGGIHISEPGLQSLVRAAMESGRMKISDMPERADAFIIAVPTPFYHDDKGVYKNQEYRLADMRMVIAAAESIVDHLQPGNLVILESTSPPRTTVDLIQPILEKSGLKAGSGFLLAYSPERVLPGRIIQELTENARVIGGINQASSEAGRDLYAKFVIGEIVLTDATTAEMVKLMENTYRDVNIAIANEFSRLAERHGVNIWEAISIANRHPRVKILNPGVGVGGHCISVDPWFLVQAAPDLTELITAARHVNDAQPQFIFNLVKSCIGDNLKGIRIAALGLAFKPDVDDLRESPAIEVASLLAQSGAEVQSYEPYKLDSDVPGVISAATLEEAVRDADVLLLLVGHSQFKSLLPTRIRDISSAQWAIDAIGGWDNFTWTKAGFKFARLGAPGYGL
jgi:UDP-N-acetyl-D-mannosaminuronic acid dehydrogenase